MNSFESKFQVNFSYRQDTRTVYGFAASFMLFERLFEVWVVFEIFVRHASSVATRINQDRLFPPIEGHVYY